MSLTAFILSVLAGPFELLCALASFLTGYVRHIQYRTDDGDSGGPVQSFADLERDTQLESYAFAQRHLHIERYREFIISHIEFDDQGKFWDIDQLATLEREIIPEPANESGAPGVILVCFVHGWNNNAQYWNGNLRSFRAVLHDLHETEQSLCQELGLTPRRIVGVYISWRGLAHRWPGLKFLTFWNRKYTSHKVGRGDLVNAISRIEQMRFHQPLDKKMSRMIVIGHSFGGAAVYSAVAPYIETVAVGEDQAKRVEGSPYVAKIRGVGDLVVLVNPAFEALLYDGINRLVDGIDHYDPIQHVVLMTIGAENDGPTRLAFPFGQFLGRWHERKRSFTQAGKICRTVANYDPFIHFELKPNPQSDPKQNRVCGKGKGSINSWQSPPARTLVPRRRWDALIPRSRNWQLSAWPNRKVPDHCPFMTIRAREGIIDNHNGIFLTFFVEFLRDFVIAYDLYVAGEKRQRRVELLAARRAAHRVRQDAKAAGEPAPKIRTVTPTPTPSGYMRKQ